MCSDEPEASATDLRGPSLTLPARQDRHSGHRQRAPALDFWFGGRRGTLTAPRGATGFLRAEPCPPRRAQDIAHGEGDQREDDQKLNRSGHLNSLALRAKPRAASTSSPH